MVPIKKQIDKFLREQPHTYLNAGEARILREPALVYTILGSCVSVTLFQPILKLGAIHHSLLPYGSGGRDFRYVDDSLKYMLEQFDLAGAARSAIEAKVFGGADMFGPEKIETVGQKNVQAAMDIIKKERLKLVAFDVRGFRGRRLLFNSGTGEVIMELMG